MDQPRYRLVVRRIRRMRVQQAGDRVNLWMTLNEPQCAAFLGYAEGVHAPGKRDQGPAIQASHVLLHAHALAVQAYRQVSPAHHRIGIAIDVHPMYPYSDGISDQEAARVADGRTNRWFLDPVMKGSYPEDILALYTKHKVAPAGGARGHGPAQGPPRRFPRV